MIVLPIRTYDSGSVSSPATSQTSAAAAVDLAVAAFDASWPSWRGRAIEPYVNEAVTRLSATHPELAGVQQAGAWWNRDNSLEVDIVAAPPTTSPPWARSSGDRGAE